ncbi:pyruvate decarboxylase [Amniculibacterium aquaticum]|uniref:pyruvate decarboxylase n=1 Tax=Amniculibacterium aquaticum TaxID=2479858 RepID=UPI000F5B55D3|nr:pyruvate decarboxylase [Amniculibacterium aquaticum]
MKRNKILIYTTVTVLLGGLAYLKAQQLVQNKIQNNEIKQLKSKKILYFNPDIQPDLEEIKEPSNSTFFSAASDKLSENNQNILLRADQLIPFDEVNPDTIKEYCLNNQADYAVVSKIKYFKVGLGKYVFSSQVIVGMKLYNAHGDLLTETQYDTYKKNKRLLGSAENFVKLGTKGALKEVLRCLKLQKTNSST